MDFFMAEPGDSIAAEKTKALILANFQSLRERSKNEILFLEGRRRKRFCWSKSAGGVTSVR
jgi:hypothetical protein